MTLDYASMIHFLNPIVFLGDMTKEESMRWAQMDKEKQAFLLKSIVYQFILGHPEVPTWITCHEWKKLLHGAVLDQVRVNWIDQTRMILFLQDIDYCFLISKLKTELSSFLEYSLAKVKVEHHNLFTTCIVPYEQIIASNIKEEYLVNVSFYVNMDAIFLWMFQCGKLEPIYNEGINSL